MDSEREIMPGIYFEGRYMEKIPDIPPLPMFRSGRDSFRAQCMNVPPWHREEPERVEQEFVRVKPNCFGFTEVVETRRKVKPDIIGNRSSSMFFDEFFGEPSTEDILNLIEEREKPMESLIGKKIKRVTIECEDGKTYSGNIRRIEGNPYNIRECMVEVTVGTPVGTYGIKEVIFANPTTIVKWTDGTQTVVSCMDNAKIVEKTVNGKKIKKRKPMKCDTYSKETGLAMAIAKKCLGNTGNYNKVFKELCDVED